MATSIDDLLRAALPPHVVLGARLGAGGQGAVWGGACNGTPAAIKVFDNRNDARRIDRECSLLVSISCPYVVRILEHFPVMLGADQFRVVVYEYHNGGDLVPHLNSAAAQLTESQLIAIGSQIGTGITTLWSHRIVHRDIKPANIVRAADGRHVLVDMGLARHLDLSDITAAGGSPGTTGYRSPEQALGRRSLTLRSDVYSLGVTLFCLAVKRHPFSGRDVHAPVSLDTKPLTARALSPEFIRLIRQMLDFTAANRPTDLITRFAALGAI